MNNKKANPRSGGSFNKFLKRERLYRKVEAQAEKEILAWKLRTAMEEKNLTVAGFAKRLRTSRAATARILDPANTSITLATLKRAATALGKRWRFELVEG